MQFLIYIQQNCKCIMYGVTVICMLLLYYLETIYTVNMVQCKCIKAAVMEISHLWNQTWDTLQVNGKPVRKMLLPKHAHTYIHID